MSKHTLHSDRNNDDSANSLDSSWSSNDTYQSRSLDETIAFGNKIGRLLVAGDVVLLTGDLGAGKTQFSRGVGAALRVDEPIVSPTFNILLEHRGILPLYHFDLYRLDMVEQLDDIDYWAITEADGISLVEWGDKFGEVANYADLEITLRRTSDTEREITVVAISPRGRLVVNALEQEDSE